MTVDNKDYSNLTQSELIHISKYHDRCGGPRRAFILFFIREPDNVEEVEAFIGSFYTNTILRLAIAIKF